MNNNFDDIKEFHAKFGLHPKHSRPHLLDDDVNDFRVRFLKEELQEYIDAYWDDDLSKAADALIDLAYVAMGTAYLMGLPWNELWDEVHGANMKKVRVESADKSKRGHAYDVVKPTGWQPPSFARIFKRYGVDVEE